MTFHRLVIYVTLIISLLGGEIRAQDYLIKINKEATESEKIELKLPTAVLGDSAEINIYLIGGQNLDIPHGSISCHCVSIASVIDINGVAGSSTSLASLTVYSAQPGNNVVFWTIPDKSNSKILRNVILRWNVIELISVENINSSSSGTGDHQQSNEADIIKISTDFGKNDERSRLSMVVDAPKYCEDFLKLGELKRTDPGSWNLTIPRSGYKFYGIFGLKVTISLFSGNDMEVNKGIGQRIFSIPVYNKDNKITISPSRVIFDDNNDDLAQIKVINYSRDAKESGEVTEDINLRPDENGEHEIFICDTTRDLGEFRMIRFNFKNFKAICGKGKGYIIIRCKNGDKLSIPFLHY